MLVAYTWARASHAHHCHSVAPTTVAPLLVLLFYDRHIRALNLQHYDESPNVRSCCCRPHPHAGMASLSLVLCDDRHIRALNLQHRDKDAPTDVLSFEMDDDLDYVVRRGCVSYAWCVVQG